MAGKPDYARLTGWEYMGDEIAGPSPSMADVMTCAVLNGLPENGGWEMMLPWQTRPDGSLFIIFKRPMSAIQTAQLSELPRLVGPPLSPGGDKDRLRGRMA